MRPRAVAAVVTLAVIVFGLGGVVGALVGGDLIRPGDQRPGPVDIGFAQDMSAHHSQAIAMADIVAANPDSELASLVAGVKSSQTEEIGRMQGFLTLWGEPAIGSDRPMGWMGHDNESEAHSMPGMDLSGPEVVVPTADESGMPGMATTDELSRLRSSTGQDQVVLFLQLMLRHHRAGVQMADYAVAHAWIPAMQALAGRMSFDQQQESQLMEQLLVARRAHA